MTKTTATTISAYNKLQIKQVGEICQFLQSSINSNLKKASSKIWHGSPVWFINDNPIVSYSVRKNGTVSLMFFSGQSFEESGLKPEGKFKAAEIFYTDAQEIKVTQLKRWLKQATTIQWDYKNIAKSKGVLQKITVAPVKPAPRGMDSSAHDERFAKMIFASVYPLYLAKVTRKGRTKAELDQVIKWLTGFDQQTLQKLTKEKVTFAEFFQRAKLPKNAQLITGTICGYRIEDIKNPLTKKVRYLDKVVDELAKGCKLEKILRAE